MIEPLFHDCNQRNKVPYRTYSTYYQTSGNMLYTLHQVADLGTKFKKNRCFFV